MLEERIVRFSIFLFFSIIWISGIIDIHKEMNIVNNYGSDDYTPVIGKVISLTQHNITGDPQKGTGNWRSYCTYTYKIRYAYKNQEYTLVDSSSKYESMNSIFKAYKEAKQKGHEFTLPIYVNRVNPKDAGLFCQNSTKRYVTLFLAVIVEIFVIIFIFYDACYILKKLKNRNRKNKYKRYKIHR